MTARDKIIVDFAEWTALSATRSGRGHPKAGDVLYPLLRLPVYDTILVGGAIAADEFEHWHKETTLRLHAENSELPIGWAAKLLNVYLKTRVYLAGQGRPGLVNCIHPPIDNGLREGIRDKYRNDSEIWEKVRRMSPIGGITDYKTYASIIDGCRLIARRRGILLIEVEELWQGTK